MYRKKSRGWYKHKDFILIDLACLFMALILAYLIRNGSVRNLFTLGIYRNVMIFVILVDLFLIILFESYKGVLRRGRYQELRSVIQQMILIELASGLYLFTVSGGHTFSRIILYLMGIFYVLLSYCTRIIWKKRLLHKMAEGGEHSLYIVTNYDLASKVIQNVKEHNYNRYNINGLILIDKDMTGKEIAGVPVVADLNNAPSFICQQWVDEVFVNVDETYPYPQELIEELLEMGMPVHVNLAKVRSTPGQKQFVEAIGGYTVLTTTMNYATDRQALAKRVLDILGGLVGCFLTGVIFIFIAPAIYISSPGPIFFSQTRIGKNGKPFKMYKFRSMYMDAEERKAELMAQNKMSDGRMFKLDFDPRVIGNKILPDGTRKTGIGEFIRKTSLDEFPQFWNVLNGSMSLVGTRPILQDELLKYELHHRARIAIKPGITGMWQVKDVFYVANDASIIATKEKLKDLSALEELVMVGYPIGLSDTRNNYPIFRKGYTSAHPAVDFNDDGIGLVDMACFPGSSGSPIYILNEGGYRDKHGNAYFGPSRVILLGILFAGPQYDARGDIVVKTIPTSKQVVELNTSITTNLGYYIKAEELDEFQKFIEQGVKSGNIK